MSDSHPVDPARNLLFGLLAFQLNFIERGHLLSAFDAWTTDKSRPIGRILVEQGAISTNLLGLIEGVVEEHLAKHDHEPEKSLAALSPLGSLQKDLEALADPAVQKSLLQVAANRVDEVDPWATRFGSVGTPSSMGLRYEILRPLNKGGMGVVSVALDNELDRPIALKEIREAAADNDAYRARFLAEAEITGKLEHPGIIPIYGLGAYKDGRPFYAMRLIRGDKTGSLKDAIEKFHKGPNSLNRPVEFRGLLRRFLDVCNAMAYAHSRGVLHRDLKPDNIMLGPYGETLVVDWGLAKAANKPEPGVAVDADHVRLNLSGSGMGQSMVGATIGTPEYAPPEQITGDLENIGIWSDVYGLGAVLYALMTGQPPLSRRDMELGALLVKIEAGEFPPPRQIKPEIEKPLEAICLKAMSRKPTDRYESARALADDLEKYLADEAVAAYREPWTLRSKRWARKHRTAVTSAAAMLVVGLVALAVGLFVVGGLNGKLKKTNGELVESNKKLDKANTDLAAALKSSEERKRLADENFTEALDAVKDQVFDINDQLKNSPGTRNLREKLQKSATERLKKLIERTSRRGEVDQVTMVALSNLGDVYRQLDGKPTLARELYQKANVIAKKLSEAAPNNSKAQRDLSVSLGRLGEVSLQTGDTAKALDYYRKGLDVRLVLAIAHPDDSQAQRDLSESYGRLGDVSLRTGDTAKALDYYKKGFNVRLVLAKADPDDSQAQLALSVSYINLGDVSLRTGDTAEALDYCKKGLDVCLDLAKAHPDDLRAQRALSVCYERLGDVSLRTGDTAEALDYCKKGLDIRLILAKAYPDDSRAQLALSVSYERLGDVSLGTGDTAEALDYYKKGLDIRLVLARADPDDSQAQRSLSVSYERLGDVSLGTDDTAEALDYYKKALDVCLVVAKAHPDDSQAQRDLSVAYSKLGDVSLRTGDSAKALDYYRKWLDACLVVVKAHPDDSQAQRDLSISYGRLGEVSLQTGDSAKALKFYSLGLDILRKSIKTDPTNAVARNDMVLLSRAYCLAAFLEGDYQPRDIPGRLMLGQTAYDKKFNALATRLYAESLTADPKLGDDRQAQHRYNAACSAALAGNVRPIPPGRLVEPALHESEKSKLRAQALGWLKEELAAWEAFAIKYPKGKTSVAKTLTHWTNDADLAGVRDAAGLAKLPEAEQQDWRKLWADVDALLARVSAK